MQATASTFRFACNQASRENLGDVLRGSGQPVKFWKNSAARLDCAAFVSTPAATTLVDDWSNITAAVMVMRAGGPTGALIFPEKTVAVAAVNTALTYDQWTAGTASNARHFAFDLSATDLNVVAQKSVWLAIGLMTTAGALVPLAENALVEIADSGLGDPADPATPNAYTGWSKAEADARYAAIGTGGSALQISRTTLFSALPETDWLTYLYTGTGDESLPIADATRAMTVVHLGGNDGIQITPPGGGASLGIGPLTLVRFVFEGGAFTLIESVDLRPAAPVVDDAAVDALDLAAGAEVYRRYEWQAARIATDPQTWGAFDFSAALSSRGLRRLTLNRSFGGSPDGPRLETITGVETGVENPSDAILATLTYPARGGVARPPLTVDLRGNVPPTLDAYTPYVQTLTVTADVGGSLAGAVVVITGYEGIGNSIGGGAISLTVGGDDGGQGGTIEVAVAANSSAATIAAAIATASAGTASGDTVTWTSTSYPASYSNYAPNVNTPATAWLVATVGGDGVSSLVTIIQSRGGDVRYDGDGR